MFITFEGGEGSGKSVQARTLQRRLTRLSIPTVLVHEPGGTPLGSRISRLLKWAPSVAMSPLSQLLLFNASRAQLVEEVITPALVAGQVVICDRYVDSTVAYQGYGHGLDLGTVRSVNQVATGGLTPRLTIFLDLPIAEGFARKGTGRLDRFEQQDLAFHRRVRDGYLKLAADDPARWLIVDARPSRASVAKTIWQAVSRQLGLPAADAAR